MSPYVLHGGLIGFLLVLLLNVVNGNPTGKALMNACIAALAFGLMAKWFARALFTELHHSLWQSQQAPAPEPAATEATPETAADTPDAEAAN